MDSQLTKKEQVELNEILLTFTDLFTIPTSLPPKRNCGRHIQLLDEKILLK